MKLTDHILEMILERLQSKDLVTIHHTIDDFSVLKLDASRTSRTCYIAYVVVDNTYEVEQVRIPLKF